MPTRPLVLGLTLLCLLPTGAAAQSLGVAARGGTLGLGAEAALGLGDRIVIRGGTGLLPLEVDGRFDDIDLTVEFPRKWYNVGVDLYLTGAMRIGGGMLVKPDDVGLSGTPATSWNIGGRDFTREELGTLVGRIDSGRRAPYVLLGFGRHTASGIGLSLDIGAAFLQDPSVSLNSDGGTFADDAEMRSRLDAEARAFEEDAPGYMDIWPILNLGLRIGLGG